MKIRHAVLAALFVSVLGLGARAGFSAPPAETYKIDPVHTTVGFRVKHVGMSYYHGRFNAVSGSVSLDGKTPTALEVEVKTDSIDTNDPKRDQHLKGPDFFNTKQFPTITFKSTKVAKAGEAFEATGDLTLHGVTKPVTVKFEVVGAGKDPWGGYRAGGEATFEIKRSDFGMKNMLDAIGDEVLLTVGIEATK